MPIALNDAQRMLVDSLTAWAERARPIDEVRRAADAGVPVSPAASPRGAALRRSASPASASPRDSVARTVSSPTWWSASPPSPGR
ncbi:hypothetical protein [Tsukamurella soli]